MIRKNQWAGGIRDSDTLILANLSSSLHDEYESKKDDAWTGSPFAWIRDRSSRQRGKIGEQLIAGWCATRNLNVARSPDSDADRINEGHRVEIKFSTRWYNGSYVFQQIRDQNYEFLICLGISPFRAHGWIVTKQRIPFSRLKYQHGGARGRDAWWLHFKPESPPTWLKPQDGKLSMVYRVLSDLQTK